MGEGFQVMFNNIGDDIIVIVLCGGLQVEINLVIICEQVLMLFILFGISCDVQGWLLLLLELLQVVNLVFKFDGIDVNVQFRGVGLQVWVVYDKVKIVEGCKFVIGLCEIVVGQGVKGQFCDMEVGRMLILGNQVWIVVGVFVIGDVYDLELWIDVDMLVIIYQCSVWQLISVCIEGKVGFDQFKVVVVVDLCLKLDVEIICVYYSKQGGGLIKLIDIFGKVIGMIMVVGVVFGVFNIMYVVVVMCVCEIVIMCVIGFRGLLVVMVVMLEMMLLVLFGGLFGCVVVWLLFNGYSVFIIGSNFSVVVFKFYVLLELLWIGLKWVLGIGLVGGLFLVLCVVCLLIIMVLCEI